jgi:hypothetical protein
MRGDLERKLADAQNLNDSIQNELDRLRIDNASTERDLRDQLEAARAAPRGAAEDGEWQSRYENLQQDLYEQEQITDEVRREAKQYLVEMRALSEQSGEAMEHESQLIEQVHALEAEIKDWKTRYAKARTQLRSVRTSSMGLSQPVDAGNLARNSAITSPDGLVKDVHVTRFQLSIDELLQIARGPDPAKVIDAMKSVIMATRYITTDCDAGGIVTPTSASLALMSPETPSGETKNPAKLKLRVSATANNLITAAKNHAAAQGLSPVSLLDAATSHLTTAVVDLVKICRIRPTPDEELADDFIGQDTKPLPKTPATFSDFALSPKNKKMGMNGMHNGNNNNNHVDRSDESSADYSVRSSSSPRNTGSGRGSTAWHSRMSSIRSSSRDPGLEDLKVCYHFPSPSTMWNWRPPPSKP